MSERDPAFWQQRSGWLTSLRFALNGLLRTLCTQRNMKIHWVSGTAVMLVGMALNLDLASRASVIFCVFVVICMEVLNTALEAFVDLHVKEFAQQAMRAKDAAAAAVLVLAVGAVVVFADVLLHAWPMVLGSTAAVVRTLLFGLPVLGLLAAILTIPRKVAVLVTFGAISIGLLGVLAYSSRDEVFSLGALTFLGTAVWARLEEPALVEAAPDR